MQKIDIRSIILSASPGFLGRFPAFVRNLIFNLIEKILHLNEINSFIERHSDKANIAFIEEIFEYLDFSYTVSGKDREKIPSEGKVIVVANHPLGGLDGLALLKLISEIRKDVKIIVNDVLQNIENFSGVFLPYDITNKGLQKENLNAVSSALKNEEAVILFPAGEVSRLSLKGIKDSSWQKGALYFADKFNAPVLPVFIKARNSILFYIVSMLSKRISMFLLPHELFNKKRKTISVKIGDPIPAKNLSRKIYRPGYQIKNLRKHVYQLGKNKKRIFNTEKNIIHPVDRKLIKRQCDNSLLLGSTEDGKKILLVRYEEAPDIIKEIARLREVTFRKVGEGTGHRYDSDKFDKTYNHLVLWDEKELEIVGSYRIGVCTEIIASQGITGLYTSTLFSFDKKIERYLDSSIELGRSFIQSKYWNSSALDYLWQGIGAYLTLNPNIKYLFGGVSLSNTYSEDAKNLIVYFFNKWFGNSDSMVTAKNKFIISKRRLDELQSIFNSDDYKQEMRSLKQMLKLYGFSVPTLYKQYAELCEPGGAQFLDFGVDNDFQDCVDGFIIVDVSKIKLSKKQRYLPGLIYSKPQELVLQHS